MMRRGEEEHGTRDRDDEKELALSLSLVLTS